VFAAQVCYPIWLVSYGTATLIFDGLGTTSHTISYNVTPDAEIFTRDIKRNQNTTEAYTATLSRNIDYFGNFQNAEATKIEGLIAAPALKEDFRNYLPLMREIKKSYTTKIILKPTIKNREIQDSIKQLTILKNKVQNDIKNMEKGMKLLDTVTTRRVNAIKEEIKKTRKRHYIRKKKTKKTSTKKIQQIQVRYNRKIVRTSKKFQKRLLQLNKNQAKLRKTLKNLKKEAQRCQTKLQRSRRHNRKRSEQKWNLKLTRLGKKLPTLRNQIQENTKRIRDAQNAQKLELAKQRIKCCIRIESASKKFRDLQGFEQAELIMKRQEIATLEQATRCITNLMQEKTQKKKLFNAQFEEITLPAEKHSRRLIYIPFYLVRYEKGEKKRYDLYPPSIAGGMGLLTKMKGSLGATKVKALLQTRSEAIATFLNQIPALFEAKPMLEKTVTEQGIRNSILLQKHLRSGVRKGLEELKDGNWISKNELHDMGKILYMYSSSMNKQTRNMVITENDYLRCMPA
jgi:myosin heavy subunit